MPLSTRCATAVPEFIAHEPAVNQLVTNYRTPRLLRTSVSAHLQLRLPLPHLRQTQLPNSIPYELDWIYRVSGWPCTPAVFQRITRPLDQNTVELPPLPSEPWRTGPSPHPLSPPRLRTSNKSLTSIYTQMESHCWPRDRRSRSPGGVDL